MSVRCFFFANICAVEAATSPIVTLLKAKAAARTRGALQRGLARKRARVTLGHFGSGRFRSGRPRFVVGSVWLSFAQLGSIASIWLRVVEVWVNQLPPVN